MDTLATPTNPIQRKIFRAYDIRGIVGEDFGIEQARQIGCAIAKNHPDVQLIAIGRDSRLSSKAIADALIQSLNSCGVNTLNIGEVPTPALYFAALTHTQGSGLMVTGSHNPKQYNGIKMMLAGKTLFGDDILALYETCQHQQPPAATKKGKAETLSILDAYIEKIISDVELNRSLRVAVDCGNGVAGPAIVALLERLGCDAFTLYCEPDGNFPNHHPDPTRPENLTDLITVVKDEICDLGLALDGDGDRLGVVDDLGNIIWADRQMMLFSHAVLQNTPGQIVIYDVKSSQHLPKLIAAYGGKPMMCRTGHSFIKEAIQKTDAVLAGEMSGHIFFNDRWLGFDDGLYAAARMLEIVAASNVAFSTVCAALPQSINTPEINIHLNKTLTPHAFMQQFVDQTSFEDATINLLDGFRADFEYGWGLIRASNTTPCLVLRFEADTEQALQNIQQRFREAIVKIDKTLTVPF